ncbi:MAG: orotate phosphoribosyltransferase [Tissierellia bacterium]|nr:orotate phosphoribosyltransferase [Tissierellia bacterium]
MQDYKKEFIEFMLENESLKFGDFTLKSGRKSPFFMNAGNYNDGHQLLELSKYYAQAIHDNFGLDFDILFGPSYKGIPLAVATTMAIYSMYGKKIKYSSNRKEIKDHGDTGVFLGEKLQGKQRVIIIEDVTTSGKSIDETYPIITQNPEVEVIGLVVSLDRCEHAKDIHMSALTEVGKKYNLKTASLVTMEEVIDYLKAQNSDILSADLLNRINKYYEEYGVKE